MYFNLKLNKITFLLLFVMALFTACQKEEVEPTPQNNISEQASFLQLQNQAGLNSNDLVNNGSAEMDCFSFVYPIDVVLPGGTTQTANNDEELETIVETWIDQNPNSSEFPTFDFPIEVINEDGTSQTVNDEETLCALFEACWDGFDDPLDIDLELCFDLVYPVELVLPDGVTQVVNDDEELHNTVVAWFEANPTSEEDPTFTYPIEVVFDDVTQPVNSDDELEALFDECDDEDDYELCFDITYPVQIVFPDGNTVEVDGDDALFMAAESWYEQNPTSEEDPTFAYPIEVTLEDGTQQSINSDEEAEALFEQCYDEDEEGELKGNGPILIKHRTTLAEKMTQRN